MKKQIKRKKKNRFNPFPLIIIIILGICVAAAIIYKNKENKDGNTTASTDTAPQEDTTFAVTDEITGEITDLLTDSTTAFKPEATTVEISESVSTEAPVTDAPDITTAPATQTAAPDYGDEIDCGNLTIIGNRALEIFYGNKDWSGKYADYVNHYAELLKGKATVYSMVVPKSAAYYIGESKYYAKTQPNTKTNLDIIKGKLNTDVKSVDVYSALGKHTDEDIYFRTDHHWTALGAYYAAEELAKTAGVPFDDISKFSFETRKGYLGSMYGYSKNNKRLSDYPDNFDVYRPDTAKYESALYSNDFTSFKEHDIFYYVPDEKPTNWYLTFMNGDNGVMYIKTKLQTGRKLIIIKDSFGNALVPYFMSSFDEIYIVDFRMFKLNVINFIEDKSITDCVVCLNTFNTSSNAASQLIVLCTQ